MNVSNERIEKLKELLLLIDIILIIIGIIWMIINFIKLLFDIFQWTPHVESDNKEAWWAIWNGGLDMWI